MASNSKDDEIETYDLRNESYTTHSSTDTKNVIGTGKYYTIQINSAPHFELIYCPKTKSKTNFHFQFQPNHFILFYIIYILFVHFKTKWKRRMSFKNTHEPSLCFTSKNSNNKHTIYTSSFYFIEQSKCI